MEPKEMPTFLCTTATFLLNYLGGVVRRRVWVVGRSRLVSMYLAKHEDEESTKKSTKDKEEMVTIKKPD